MTVLSNEEILQAIAQKPVMDIVKLIEMMEKEFNVSAAAAAVAMPMMGAAPGAAAALARSRAGLAADLAPGLPAAVLACRRRDARHCDRCRPGQCGPGAHAPPPAAARCRPGLFARERSRHARAAAAVARAGHAAHRQADAQSPRSRSRRWCGGDIGSLAGECHVVVA